MKVYKAVSHSICPVLVAIYASSVGAQMEEILVTSQHREQTLQDVSVAVTVIDSQVLDDFSVDRIEALGDFTPGMTVATSPGNFTAPSIRGIGSNTGAQTLENSVGMFVDGVYASRFRQYQASVFDVDRIEVVKGGQGTLYGRNSSVGVISLTTRLPGEELGGYAIIEYETEFQTNVVSAAVDLPVSDSFRVRLAGKYLDDPGYVKNTATSDDNPDREEQAFRATAVWDVSDNFEAIFRYTYAEFDALGNADEVVRDPGSVLTGLLDTNPLAEGGPNYVKSSSSVFFAEEDNQETNDMSLRLNWSFGDHVLTAITGISDLEMTNFYNSDAVSGIPNPAIGAPALLISFDEDFEQFTQEIRLASPTGGNFEYLLGAFYIDQEYDFDQSYYAFTVPVPGFSNFVTQDMQSWSVFGQGTWHFNDTTRLTGSLRYSEEEKDGSIDVVALGSNSDTLDDDAVDWSLTLAKDFGDHMAYVSGSKSTKSGGLPNAPAALVELYMPAEEVESFEVGLKLALEAGYLNVAAYTMDITDYQSSRFDGSAFQFNSVDGTSEGIELDGLWQLSDGLSLRGTAAYNNADVDHPTLVFTRAPELTATAAADFETSLSDSFYFRGSLWAVYTDDFWHQTEPGIDLDAEAHTKVHARLGVTHQSSGIEVALLGQNLTDEKIREFAFNEPLYPAAVVSPLSRPRTFTVQLNIPF